MDMRQFSLAKHDPELEELIRKTDQLLLARFAIDCIERVMPLLENKYKNELRPRTAIDMLKKWMNGEMKMWDARKYTYPALACARELEDTDKAACQVARGCSHTLATCHVKTHAEGSAMYAVSAIKYHNMEKDNVYELMASERTWQIRHLMELREKE